MRTAHLLLAALVKHSDKPTLEELKIFKQLQELEYRRWNERVRLVLVFLAIAIFLFSYWRMSSFLGHATDTQLTLATFFRLGLYLLGFSGPVYFLIQVFRHYLPEKK